MTTYDSAGNESPHSNEASKSIFWVSLFLMLHMYCAKRLRQKVEEIFGEMKTIEGLRRTGASAWHARSMSVT